MESSSLAEDRLSPESTVTSLLSSSGHLRSDLQPPELSSSFTYRNKDYDSASAALDAYIADFEKSCQNCQSLTGSLVLPRDSPSSPTTPRVGSLRNRDVLRERLTDRELDFLKLPVSSFLHHGNSDRLSMTTDELLSISYDGSMPVTHTSAFLQGLLSRSGTSQPRSSSTRLVHKTRTGLSINQAGPVHLNQHSDPSSSRAADLHLPRWLTSNKSVMDWSEIGSLPDLKYPAWVRHCDVTELDAWDNCAGPPRTRAAAWISNLEKDSGPHGTPGQEESRCALRDIRVQLAQELLLLAARGESSNDTSVLFRENRIESLIEKADQVLNLLSQTSDRTESSAGPGRRLLGVSGKNVGHSVAGMKRARQAEAQRDGRGTVLPLAHFVWRV
ncbi:lung adenoma susceptibility protein 2 [Nematolebias whitei]|uniref:lung adenoma susceptibility protein 2 n=1 Tax=Nematolebias whitei TaxID=451745 RepID=UPI0018989620|nr:lung adenoma susceptibility protein 2 [Nematolebias whitei]